MKNEQKYIHKKSKGVAIFLAIFFSFFVWTYTYKYDATKFWLALTLNLFLFWTLIVPLIILIYAIIDTANKEQQLFEDYFK